MVKRLFFHCQCRCCKCELFSDADDHPNLVFLFIYLNAQNSPRWVIFIVKFFYDIASFFNCIHPECFFAYCRRYGSDPLIIAKHSSAKQNKNSDRLIKFFKLFRFGQSFLIKSHHGERSRMKRFAFDYRPTCLNF